MPTTDINDAQMIGRQWYHSAKGGKPKLKQIILICASLVLAAPAVRESRTAVPGKDSSDSNDSSSQSRVESARNFQRRLRRKHLLRLGKIFPGQPCESRGQRWIKDLAGKISYSAVEQSSLICENYIAPFEPLSCPLDQLSIS